MYKKFIAFRMLIKTETGSSETHGNFVMKCEKSLPTLAEIQRTQSEIVDWAEEKFNCSAYTPTITNIMDVDS